MDRPFYPQEADDPDLDWLISNFLYENPDYIPVEVGMLPLILIPFRENKEIIGETDLEDDSSIAEEDSSDILT